MTSSTFSSRVRGVVGEIGGRCLHAPELRLLLQHAAAAAGDWRAASAWITGKKRKASPGPRTVWRRRGSGTARRVRSWTRHRPWGMAVCSGRRHSNSSRDMGALQLTAFVQPPLGRGGTSRWGQRSAIKRATGGRWLYVPEHQVIAEAGEGGWGGRDSRSLSVGDRVPAAGARGWVSLPGGIDGSGGWCGRMLQAQATARGFSQAGRSAAGRGGPIVFELVVFNRAPGKTQGVLLRFRANRFVDAGFPC